MTAANAPTCIGLTIDLYEGGYDSSPKDRGNWTSGIIGQGQLKGTKYGIAAHVYPHLDIKSLTRNDAIAIYQRDYWPKVAGDQLPEGVDFTAWDAGVNSGPSRALKWLGSALGSTQTAARTLADLAVRAPDKVAVIKKANSARRSFLIGLRNVTYEKGWLKRVANVEARSIAMQLTVQKKAPAEIKDALNGEAKASDQKRTGSAAGTGTTTAGGGAEASRHEWAFDWATVGELVLIVAVVGLTVFFVWKFIEHRKRAQEMRAVAASL